MMNTTPISGKKLNQFELSHPIALKIVGGTDFGRYKKISCEETFNLIIPDLEKPALVPWAGYKSVAQIAGNEGREIFAAQRYKHLIAVIDNGVYEISTTNSYARIGTINTSSGPVYIAENDAGQIGIADGLNIWIYDYVNNTFTTPTIDFLPTYLTFMDGYFIAADGRTNQWRLSDVNDGNSWPPSAAFVGLLESAPTNTQAVVRFNRQLFVFGSNVIEPWYDTGGNASVNSLFPFSRNDFFNIPEGCIAPETIACDFNLMVWFGSNPAGGYAIMVSKGGAAEKISNDGLDFKFARLKHPEDSFGYLCRIDGHIYYVITFRKDNLTYAYDFSTNLFFTMTDENLNHHISKRIAFFNNKYYFLSFIDGNIYELSSDYTTYNGKTIPRGRILPPFRLPSNDKFIVKWLTITLEEGMTKEMQKAEISLSKDGGESYGNIGQLQFNAFGDRQSLFQMYKLGMANDLTIKLQFWSKGRFVLLNGMMMVAQ